MKTPLYIMFVLLLVMATFSTVAAQEPVTKQGDISVGASINLGTNVGGLKSTEPGLTLNGYYGVTDEIRVGAGFTHFFLGEEGVSAREFNIDGHYIFKNEDGLVLYALGGLNFASLSMDFGFGKVTGNDTGVNLGGGVEYNLGPVFLFGEPKLTIGGFDQFNVTGGVRMRF